MAERKAFLIRIVTPERVFYEGRAVLAEFTTTEGELGVYAEHIPLTAALLPDAVKIHGEDGSVREAAVHSGFAEILPERVTILAEAAEWPGEIDSARAERAGQRARERLNSRSGDVDVARAELALRRALTRLELSGKH